MREPINYGGQAVIEGVMMRGPRSFTVACRRVNGEIVEKTESLESFLQRFRWLNRPILRGTLALIDTLVLGIKALEFSSRVALADLQKEKGGSVPDSVSNLAVGASMALGLGLGVGLFIGVPSLVAGLLKGYLSAFQLNVLEGFLRLVLFLGYIGLIGLMEDVRRIFQYHGAEHKTINAYEAGAPLEVQEVQKFSRLHPRCGTSFVLLVLCIATLAHLGMGWPVWYLRLLSRLLVLPLVAGFSYEIVRYAGKHKDAKWLRWALAPGLWTQKLTTREPTEDQVEVAIRALKGVLRTDGALEYALSRYPHSKE